MSEAAPAVHPDHLHPARRRNPAQQPRRPLPLAAQGTHVCARLLGEKLLFLYTSWLINEELVQNCSEPVAVDSADRTLLYVTLTV